MERTTKVIQERFSFREERNTCRLFAAISSSFLRGLLEQAAERIGADLRFGTFWPDLEVPGRPSIIVHDFVPDLLDSLSWLDEAAQAPASPTVFALLETHASATLDALARTRHRFRISGVAIASEDGAGAVADRLSKATTFGSRTWVADLVLRDWRLDPSLADLVRVQLLAEPPHTTLGGLLHEVGLGRKRFVSLARRAGFEPPARLFQSLRVLRAGALLGASMTLTQVRDALGYGSPATLRRHFRDLVGVSPDHARVFSAQEMVLRLAPGARPMPELVDPVTPRRRRTDVVDPATPRRRRTDRDPLRFRTGMHP